jgi:hypothetical protein
MKLRFQQLIFVALTLIPITGCQIPTFSNPLVDPADAEVPQEILGSYLLVQEQPATQVTELPFSLDDDPVTSSLEYQHIGIAGDDYPPGFVRIVRVDVPQNSTDKIEYSSLVGFSARIGDHFVLHIPVPRKLPIDETTYQNSWDPENFEGYLLAVITPTDSGLELQMLDTDFIVAEINAGRLAGNYTPRQSAQGLDQSGEPLATPPPELTVTANQESLVAFFKQHLDGDLIFGDPTRYRRIK